MFPLHWRMKVTVTKYTAPAGRTDTSKTADQMATVANRETVKASGTFDELRDPSHEEKSSSLDKTVSLQQVTRAGLKRG